MSTNDQIILDQILEEQRVIQAPAASKAEYFEIYSAEQILKDYELSTDEVEYGIVGGGLDGGLDAIYTLVNGELVQEDFDSSALKRNILIEIILIQSKTASAFDEDTINKFMTVSANLLALQNSLEEFVGRYNAGVLEAMRIFRQLYSDTASRFPTVVLNYVYVSKGESGAVHPNVRAKAADLKGVVSGLFPKCEFRFSFLGAADLLALARKQPVTSFDIQFTESLTGDSGYIALVKLRDFNKFIAAGDGLLRKRLFEANVRDYQGATQVNEDMQVTLMSGGAEDFWWLNNGVTVVATKATQAGKVLTVEDPQIVNGQQTSTEIFNYFQSVDRRVDDRCVMLRVIVATEAASRDRIIKATNSQTAIPIASLRATEKIHRDIEDYLSKFGIYYDRRKNSHRQQGRSADKIISISLLAQSIMSILLQRPDDARARPSSLIRNDGEYLKIFDSKTPIGVFLVGAVVVKKVHTFLMARTELAPRDRNNLKFYLAMCVVAMLAKRSSPSAVHISALPVDDFTDGILSRGYGLVKGIYDDLGANDQVAKGPSFIASLKSKLSEIFGLRTTREDDLFGFREFRSDVHDKMIEKQSDEGWDR